MPTLAASITTESECLRAGYTDQYRFAWSCGRLQISFTGLHFNNTDLSIQKEFCFGERVVIQLRKDAFNAFNQLELQWQPVLVTTRHQLHYQLLRWPSTVESRTHTLTNGTINKTGFWNVAGATTHAFCTRSALCLLAVFRAGNAINKPLGCSGAKRLIVSRCCCTPPLMFFSFPGKPMRCRQGQKGDVVLLSTIRRMIALQPRRHLVPHLAP